MDSFRMTSCGVGGATGWDMSIDGMSVGDGGPIWRTMRVLCVCVLAVGHGGRTVRPSSAIQSSLADAAVTGAVVLRHVVTTA